MIIMGRLIEELFLVFVGLVTGVTSLDVYLDTEKRAQVPGNTNINCTLPYFNTSDGSIGSLHNVNHVGSEEKVWVGRQSTFTKWMDFRGCIKKNFSSEFKNKAIEVSDPFLACYKFCKSLSFMLSSVKCICLNVTREPERQTFKLINESIVGGTNNVMCMYKPLAYYTDDFSDKPDENCIFAFKTENTLRISNDLCSATKKTLCVSSAGTFHVQKTSTWLDNTKTCQDKGRVFASYWIIENRNESIMVLKRNEQYWIAAFRRPLHTCLAAVLYTNGTIGKPTPTSCNTSLPSLCIRSGTSGGSTGNFSSGEPTGNAGVEGSTGNIAPGITTGSIDPTPVYVWVIVASIGVVCIVIAILLSLLVRKRSKSKNNNLETKTKSSASNKDVSSTQTRGAIQPPGHVNAASTEDNQESEYHTIGASGSEDGIYHELHERPRLQQAPECSNYDHVTHVMITDNTQYDVFCGKGKSSNSDNVISDYDTTFSIQQQLEGDYDTGGGRQNLIQDLSDYDVIAGSSQANEVNSI